MRKEAEAKAERGIRPADRRKGVTVLGIGNILYSDEGLGVHILPELRKALRGRERVEIIEGATDGLRLLGPVEEAEYLIVIDAIRAEAEPGTIIVLKGGDIPAYFSRKLSIHQIGFQEVLQAAQWRGKGPKEVMLFGIEPASLAFGIGLSEEVRQAVPALIDAVVGQIERWGIGP
ncbi:MAG: HyaD/HybD family hydrogenase maturation endopeptidase [Planifilum fulgidum]|nr:hydrogenase maturation protease [Bacillota bacterium]MBO2533040.1 hydrogenase maturation protease [Thermoactinomycetaceae bacterium]